MRQAFFSLKARLIVNFSIVIFIGAVLSVMVGIRLIGNTVINQAQEKVRLDLNSAQEVYRGELFTIENTVRLTAIRFFLIDAIINGKVKSISRELDRLRKMESLDVLNLTDPQGNVVIRSRNPGIEGDRLERLAVERVIANKTAAASAQIVPGEYLEREGKDLAEQAGIPIIFTPKGYKSPSPGPGPVQTPTSPVETSTSGMVIGAAAPVLDYNGRLIGLLYGEKLLNRRYEIVDKVKDIVYRGQKFKGKDIGTVTIFQDGLRISTNVTRADGTRAIGTQVSREVYDRVMVKGVPWTHRAFVVKDWYITAYQPIKDLEGKIIGMLYVGILEAPYIELRNQVILNFIAVALLSLFLSTCIALFTATRTVKPIKELMTATKKVARGDLSHRVKIRSRDEIGELAESFNQMAVDLEKVTQQYQTLNRSLEDRIKEKTRELKEAEDQLIQSAKLSSIGKMAAGVAHEINNPLTSILINAHLLAEELPNPGGGRENLQIIIEETTRCSTIVKDLLHFSRQTEANKTPTVINEVIEKTLFLLKSHVLLQKVKITKNLGEALPRVVVDTSKMGQVFANIILNALDAMPGGGELTIVSRTDVHQGKTLLEILFQDTGCGIPKKNLGKIFDPFFTTKGTKGTGLGLSVTYGILRQHGGRIHVRSEEGMGTTITVVLPVNPAHLLRNRQWNGHPRRRKDDL